MMNQCVLFSKGGSLLTMGFQNRVAAIAESFALMCVHVCVCACMCVAATITALVNVCVLCVCTYMCL